MAGVTEPKTRFSVDDLPMVDRYKLMTGLVVPRPIGWIGSKDPDGVANLAPYSFFQAVATNPPVVLFSAGVVQGRVKDSLANVRSSGVFTANLVDVALAAAMNETSAEVAPDVDEFGIAGLTAEYFGTVDAPGVAEAKAVLECRVMDEKVIGDDAQTNVIVFGEVVCFHVADAVLDGTRIDPVALDAVGRLAGSNYATTRDLLVFDRPR